MLENQGIMSPFPKFCDRSWLEMRGRKGLNRFFAFGSSGAGVKSGTGRFLAGKRQGGNRRQAAFALSEEDQLGDRQLSLDNRGFPENRQARQGD